MKLTMTNEVTAQQLSEVLRAGTEVTLSLMTEEGEREGGISGLLVAYMSPTLHGTVITINSEVMVLNSTNKGKEYGVEHVSTIKLSNIKAVTVGALPDHIDEFDELMKGEQ